MYTIENTLKNQGYNKLQVLKMAKTDTFEILGISLEKGTVFPAHTSPTDALLIMLEGDIVFHINNGPYHLKALQHFSFPKEAEHWVSAKEDSKFLIIR